MPTAVALNLFPVKSLRGCRVPAADVEPWGLAGDRRFMIVDPQGHFLTQRQLPRMATIEATAEDADLHLSRSGHVPLSVRWPGPQSGQVSVTVWRDRLVARLVDPAADRWLSAALGQPCRLVYMAEPADARSVDLDFGTAADRVSFADGFPLLLTSTASLADLNARMEHPLGMERFRTNVVVDGAIAWAEDGWRTIRIGAVSFDVVKPCARCVITTTDQQTGERHPDVEPIRSLQRFRRDAKGQVLFGQNLIPRSTGRIAAGDPVEILR